MSAHPIEQNAVAHSLEGSRIQPTQVSNSSPLLLPSAIGGYLSPPWRHVTALPSSARCGSTWPSRRFVSASVRNTLKRLWKAVHMEEPYKRILGKCMLHRNWTPTARGLGRLFSTDLSNEPSTREGHGLQPRSMGRGLALSQRWARRRCRLYCAALPARCREPDRKGTTVTTVASDELRVRSSGRMTSPAIAVVVPTGMLLPILLIRIRRIGLLSCFCCGRFRKLNILALF